MRVLTLFLILPLFSRAAASLQKYVSPDQSFTFTFPAGYGLHADKSKENAGESYIPVCHDDSTVCITFPPDQYKGTTFGAASFEVTPVKAGTVRACANSEAPAKDPGRVIDGVRFAHTVEGDAAMSHIIESNLYQGFKNGKCYQLAIRVTSTNFAVYSPGAIKEFTKQDNEQVVRDLTRILDSFRIPR
jgi:hypothetical protein